MRALLFRGRRLAPAAVVAGFVAIMLAMPAAAAGPNVDLSGGCTIELTATGVNGEAAGTASGPGTASADNPFVVDPKGTVTWTATAPTIKNATYSVSVYQIPLLSGTFANEGGGSAATGTLDLSGMSILSQLAGIVYVSGGVRGDGGACDGAAWVKLGGSPLTSTPGLVGILLGVLGLVGVVISAVGSHPFRGLGFGVLLGIGLALLSIVFGFMPLGQWTPYVCLVAGPVIGAIVGFLKIGGVAAAAA